MPSMTAGRPADADEIRSYSDIVAAHRVLCGKAAAGKGEIYALAANRVAGLGRLYHKADEITDEIRAIAQTALAAVHAGVRAPRNHAWEDRLDVADAWLDHLSLLVNAPTDGR
jgi:hypothetical protein